MTEWIPAGGLTDWLQFGGIFLGVCGLAFVLCLLVLRRPAPDRRLPRGAAEGDDKPADEALVLGQFTGDLSGYLPAQQEGAGELAQDLKSAGYYRPTAVIEYKAVRNLLVVVALLLTGTLALLVPESQLGAVLICGGVAALLAFSVPRLYLVARGRLRSRAIERGLPLVIDLLILCLSAGQNLLGALLLVARQMRRAHPVLAQELTIAHQQAELHSLEHALKQWADRVRLPEVKNLVMLLIQSEKLGADAAATLNELANNFRVTARQRAEARASRLSFWMLFPSVFCFWVAGAIILIGPAYVEFFHYQRQVAEMLDQSKSSIDRTIQQDPGTPQPFPLARPVLGNAK